MEILFQRMNVGGGPQMDKMVTWNDTAYTMKL